MGSEERLPKRRYRTRRDGVDYGRRRALKWLLLGGGALGAAALGVWRPWERRPNFRGAEPDPDLDSELVQQIIDVEAGYTREDLLGDPEILRQHLELSAEFFASYIEKSASKDELVNSVEWLPKVEYEERFPPHTAGHGDHITGRIYIKTEAANFESSTYREIKKEFPYWSALTMARLIYWHEFFHKTVRGPRDPERGIEKIPGPGNKENIIPLLTYGLVLAYQDPNTGEVFGEESLEEALTGALTSAFDGLIVNRFFFFWGSERERTAIEVGESRLKELFGKKDWLLTFRDYQRESDFFGLAGFLANHSGIEFSSGEERINHGVRILWGITAPESDPNYQVFQEFFTNLKPDPLPN